MPIYNNVEEYVRHYLAKNSQLPKAVHRLDMDTSGLLVLALNDEAYVELQRQFASREVSKRYEAVLDGKPSVLCGAPGSKWLTISANGREGRISLPIIADIMDRPRQRVDFDNGKTAVTDYRIERVLPNGHTLVSLYPLTGRTHQLRVHCAHNYGLGCPILGDPLYGHGCHTSRMYLHADICCIGHITKDKIITPRQTVYMAGGTSFYFSYAFSHLPQNVSFQLVTKLGEGEMKSVEDMRQAGIDVQVYPSSHTVYFENKYGENQNDRTQRVLERADPFTVDEMREVNAGVYHLGSLLSDDFSTEVVKYLSTKGRISIDAQGYLREVRGEKVYPIDWAEKLEILAHTDIIKVNEHEMEVITGFTDPRAAAKCLAEWGVKEVCVTLGSEGSIILAEGKFYDIPAYEPKEIVDATGCGDTYSAGYLWCRAQGMGFEESGKFAAAMCTLKLEHSGPFDGSIDDVRRVMAE